MFVFHVVSFFVVVSLIYVFVVSLFFDCFATSNRSFFVFSFDFVCLFVCLFVCSFVRSFVCLFVCLLIGFSFFCSFTRLLSIVKFCLHFFDL